RPVHGHIRDFRRGHFQRRKETLDVASVITASQFNHADALPFSICMARKAIELRYIARRKWSACRLLSDDTSRMTQGARPVVQSENIVDQVSDFFRNMNRAGDAAVRAARVIVLRHFHAKHFAEISGLSAKHHAMPSRRSLHDLESVPSRKALHLG